MIESTRRASVQLPPLLQTLMIVGTAFFLLGAGAAPLSLTVADASLAVDPSSQEPLINIKLAEASTKAFGDFTSANVGKKIDVLIDGKVVSSPVVRDPILLGAIQISGDLQTAKWPTVRRLKNGHAHLAVTIDPVP